MHPWLAPLQGLSAPSVTVLLLCCAALYLPVSDACDYDLVKACLRNGRFGNLSSTIQANLFVSLTFEEHELFCREWTEKRRKCVTLEYAGCDKLDLEHAFHGLVHSYDYLCEEDTKKKYEKVRMCATNEHFVKQSKYCTRGFTGGVSSLDSRLAPDDRYEILLEEKPQEHLQKHWMETCTRMNEYIICQKSVIKYCGQAQVFTREKQLEEKEKKKNTDLTKEEKGELKALKRKKEKTEDAGYHFQEHFMHVTLEHHYGLVNCNRLSTLALVLIIFTAVLVFVVLVCLIPFCCCNRRGRFTSWQRDGADNTGFVHEETPSPHKTV